VTEAAAIASMRKSVLLLAAAGGLCVALALLSLAALRGGAGIAAALVLLLLSLPAWLLLGGGRLAIERQRRIQAGEADLFLVRNGPRSEAAARAGDVPPWSGARRWIARQVFGHSRMVGDLVRVKSIEAIRATLDNNGCLDGLPFMDEMQAFCGHTARVYRVVDKIYDYGRSRLMRRLDRCVLLVGLRCDGAAHAGCEAACYLIWKSAWLEGDESGTHQPVPGASREVPTGELHCQYTELTQATQPLPTRNWRGWLGPWVVGNVSARAFAVAALTRAFNSFQSWRRGVGYPVGLPGDGQAPPVSETLNPGDWVRVRLAPEIARTLDKNSKNRGLWFDADMYKYCGQVFQVRGRVRQIIDVNKHAMIPMKTPCITMEDVHYTGEFQGFGEQHDYLYWREAWLQRVEPPSPAPR